MYYSRNKNKVQNPYTTIDFYNAYISDVDINSPYYVEYLEYSNIIKDYMKLLASEIIDNAGIVVYRLGSLRVVKLNSSLSRNRKFSMDYSLTQKYGKPIYHLNEHSGGYKYMFKWDKLNSIVKNKSLYRFIPTRTNKRKLAFNIKNSIIDYFEN